MNYLNIDRCPKYKIIPITNRFKGISSLKSARNLFKYLSIQQGVNLLINICLYSNCLHPKFCSNEVSDDKLHAIIIINIPFYSASTHFAWKFLHSKALHHLHNASNHILSLLLHILYFVCCCYYTLYTEHTCTWPAYLRYACMREWVFFFSLVYLARSLTFKKTY